MSDQLELVTTYKLDTVEVEGTDVRVTEKATSTGIHLRRST